MADDKPDERGGAEGPQRPKRTPPTIDLEAKDISREDISSENIPRTEMSRADGVAEAPDPDTAEPNAADDSEPHARSEPDPEPDTRPQPAAAEPAHPRGSRAATLIAALLAGAIAGGAVAGLAAQTGWLAPAPRPAKPEAPAVPLAERASVEALAARVQAVETKQAKPAPFESALAGRVDALEQGITDLRKDLDGLRSQQAAAASAIADLKAVPQTSETPAASPDMSALTARIDRIENATRALTAAVAAKPKPEPRPEPKPVVVDDKPLRRVIAATLLERAVRQGEPYADALDGVTPLVADPSLLKPLQPFASAGLPDAHKLCAELLGSLPRANPEPEADGKAGLVDRLKAGAERLVRIRRTGPQPGDSRAAVLGRAAAAARRDDLAGAHGEVRSLPAVDRAALQPWLDKVAARDAALAAARRLVAEASAALGKPAP